MLKEITDIEGLSGWDDHELKDDTPTNSMLVHFDVVAEEMPFLTEQGGTGTVVFRNFVYIFKEKHLGNFQMSRRIRDAVEWNEADQKWVIKRLHKSQSDIRQYPNEWNAFFRGAKDGGEVGVPLSLLFRQDPSRVSHYARFKINTVERLAALGSGDSDALGIGAGDDIQRAKNYLTRAKEQAPLIRAAAQDGEIAGLQKMLKDQAATISDLTNKLTELLSVQVDAAPIRRRKSGAGRKAKKQAGDENIEGVEA